jgi:hypothetical protein
MAFLLFPFQADPFEPFLPLQEFDASDDTERSLLRATSKEERSRSLPLTTSSKTPAPTARGWQNRSGSA